MSAPRAAALSADWLPEGLFRERDDGLSVQVLVTPKARRPGLLGLRARPPALRLAVAAAPEGGKATAAVLALLADLLGLPARAVTLESGAHARGKTIHLAGDPALLRCRLADAVAATAHRG